MVIRLVAVIVIIASATCAMAEQNPATVPLDSIKFPSTGKQVINASGIVPVADSRFLICDNQTHDALYELTIKPDGQPAGPLVRRQLNIKGGYVLEDLEDLTIADGPSGRILYASTSLSVKTKKKAKGVAEARPGGLVRIKFADSGPLEAEVIPEFRDWLIAAYSKTAPEAPKDPDAGGLNVEGLAWDPARGALLVGIRTPVGEGKAFVAPVKLKDPAGEWKGSNLESLPMLNIPTGATPEPLGVRGLEYDAARKAFLVVLGKAFSGADVPFSLSLWDGQDGSQPKHFSGLHFAAKTKPESASAGVVAGKPVLVIVDDAGGYWVIPDDDERLK